MRATSTYFDPDRMQLARELSGLKKNELASAIGVSAAAITGWENGLRTPQDSNVSELALRLGVPKTFLMKQSHFVNLESLKPHFRSLRSTTQVERKSARAYLALVSLTKLAFSDYVNFKDTSEINLLIEGKNWDGLAVSTKASRIREAMGLGNSPISNVLRTMEKFGVLVVFGWPHSTKVDAFSISDLDNPVIVLNPAKKDYYRQRFDLAHELGHIVMHYDAEPGDKYLENEAHQFAGEFLAPFEEIADTLPRKFGKDELYALKDTKEKWGISMQALLYRARANGVLNENEYRKYMVFFSSAGWRAQEPGNVEFLEHPTLLADAKEVMGQNGVQIDIVQQRAQIPPRYFEVITSRYPTSSTES